MHGTCIKKIKSCVKDDVQNEQGMKRRNDEKKRDQNEYERHINQYKVKDTLTRTKQKHCTTNWRASLERLAK